MLVEACHRTMAGPTLVWLSREAAMTGTGTSELRGGRRFGFAAQQVVLRCEHGGSSFVLLPGRDDAANCAALDVLWVRHTDRHGCDCVRTTAAKPFKLLA